MLITSVAALVIGRHMFSFKCKPKTLNNVVPPVASTTFSPSGMIDTNYGWQGRNPVMTKGLILANSPVTTVIPYNPGRTKWIFYADKGAAVANYYRFIDIPQSTQPWFNIFLNLTQNLTIGTWECDCVNHGLLVTKQVVFDPTSPAFVNFYLWEWY